MNDKETKYVEKFRELAAKQRQIEAAIKELHGICESLKNWRSTAFELDQPGGTGARPEWADGKLERIQLLRTLLIDYAKLNREANNQWEQLVESEKIGLAAPRLLEAPTTP